MSVTMKATMKTSDMLRINPIQLEAITVIEQMVHGKFQVYSVDENDDSKFALGLADADGLPVNGVKPFRIDTEGGVILMVDLNTDMLEDDGTERTVDFLHYAMYILGYQSLTAGDINEDYIAKAHAILHIGEAVGVPIPLTATIAAVRQEARNHGLLPR